MKPSFLLPALLLAALLLAALPATLHAAPGTVLEVLQEIADGEPGGLPTGSLVAGSAFGYACAPLGDLDGDGNPDLAVGQFNFGGVHVLFLAADGSVDRSVRIANGSGGLPAATVGANFGTSLALLGDLDGDGLPELAAGASTENAVYILFLNANGTVRRHVRIADGAGGLPAGTTGGNTLFGRSCAAVGDLDGNGMPELMVGASADDTGSPDAGALYVLFLNPDGTVAPNKTRKIAHGLGGFPTGFLEESDSFGISCTSVGDLDGDGLPEVAVGAVGDDTGAGNQGALYLFSLTQDGTVDGTPVIIAHGSGGLNLSPGARFGSSVGALGDRNGDGVSDLAVGADDGSAVGSAFGSVHILFLNPDGTVATTSKIANNAGGLPDNTIVDENASFGSSLAVLGHSPDNGLPVLAVGSIGDDRGGNFAGAVFLLELGDPPLTVTTLADEFDTPSTNGSGDLSLREAIRDADVTGQFQTIRFAPSLSGGSVLVSGGQNGPFSVSTQSLRITGESLNDGITIQGDGFDQIFSLTGAILTIDTLNLRDGAFSGGGGGFVVDGNSRLVLDRVTVVGCNGFGGGGGAILNSGSVSISNSTFLDNTSQFGGAIRNTGGTANLSVINSTFARNSVPSIVTGGGAIANSLGEISIRYSSFVENSTDNVSGAIFNDLGTVTVGESLFAGNTAAGGIPDFDESITDTGGNAFPGIDELMPFGDYGGATPVQPLKPTSTTKSTIPFTPFPVTDQRGEGFPRTDGNGRDPGAVEGLESRDFQPDGRIGLSARKQIGNNRYNASGQGQTVKLTLSGRKKTTTFFTVENDGVFVDGIRLRSVAPKKKTLKGKIFRLTGGRSNVSAQVFTSGLALGDLNPGAAVAFQADWSRKSTTLKAKQTLKITASSTIAPRSDTVGAKVGSK